MSKTNEKIDQLAERIKFDVDRLASYKRLDKVVPTEPDQPFVLIRTEAQNDKTAVYILMRDGNTGWWHIVRQGGATQGRSWSDQVEIILQYGYKVTEVKLGDWNETHDLTAKEK